LWINFDCFPAIAVERRHESVCRVNTQKWKCFCFKTQRENVRFLIINV
jgi:hypothetical protein